VLYLVVCVFSDVVPLPNAAQKKDGEDKLTPHNMAYMGCEVNVGNGKGIVVLTGMKTCMGSIAHMLNKGMPFCVCHQSRRLVLLFWLLVSVFNVIL
jgi:magnesium-transporting ATPase (P-type)